MAYDRSILRVLLLYVLGSALIQTVQCQRTVFVYRHGQKFLKFGRNFNFGGANNYYIPFKVKAQVDDLFNNAKQMGITVIRTWAFNVIGNPAGGSEWPPNVQNYLGDYFQYWNTSSWSSAFNEGTNGLQKLDYVVQKAKDSNIMLILVLSNNWGDYGGAEQMNLWYGLKHHDEFFTDWKTRMEYKKWVTYLLNRKNTYTNVAYKNESTIFGWELINEPRCKGCKDIGSCGDCAACKPANVNCTASTITNWVREMATYIKSIDRNHLVGVGDEGFLNMRPEWAYDGSDGDHEALANITEVDFLTLHSYPGAWGKSADWAKEWIGTHLNIAEKYNKPFILEEFGTRDNSGESSSQDQRNEDYDNWTKQVCEAGGNWMFWMLAAREAYSDTDTIDGKKLYPNYDQYTIYFQTADGKITPSGQKMQDRANRTRTGNC